MRGGTGGRAVRGMCVEGSSRLAGSPGSRWRSFPAGRPSQAKLNDRFLGSISSPGLFLDFWMRGNERTTCSIFFLQAFHQAQPSQRESSGRSARRSYLRCSPTSTGSSCERRATPQAAPGSCSSTCEENLTSSPCNRYGWLTTANASVRMRSFRRGRLHRHFRIANTG